MKNLEVFVAKDRDGQFYARFRVCSSDPWSFTGKHPERWMVWEDIERHLQLNNIR